MIMPFILSKSYNSHHLIRKPNTKRTLPGFSLCGQTDNQSPFIQNINLSGFQLSPSPRIASANANKLKDDKLIHPLWRLCANYSAMRPARKIC